MAEYDAFGNLTLADWTGGYDAFGNLDSTVDPGLQGRIDDAVRYGPDMNFTKDVLAKVAQAAGLPASFDWSPFLDQAAKQHQTQYGQSYSNRYTNYAQPAAAAVQLAAASNPQLAPFVSQVGEGSPLWDQGNQLRDRKLHASTSDADWRGLASVFAGPVLAGAAGALGATSGAGGAASEGAALAGSASTPAMAAGTSGALGSGITAGATGAGGLSAGATGASGISAAGAGGALAPGAFAAESLYPVVGGATAAGAGAGGGVAGSTALGRLLGLGQQGQDIASVTGAVLPSVLGLYGASQQTNAYKDLANQYASYGAPYRSQLADLYANPMGYLSSPEVTGAVQQGTDILARSLSTHGNPAGSGSALQELQNYATNQQLNRIGSEKDRLAGFGGLSAYSAAAPGAATNAIGSQANIYNAAGYGLGQVLNPQPTLADIFKQYGKAWGAV